MFRLLPLALRSGSDGTVFICQTPDYAALFSARLASAPGRRTDVFLLNFYLHRMGQHAAVRRVLKTLMRSRVGLVVQSPSEVDYYSRLAPDAVAEYEPWICEPIAASGMDAEPGDYVFSGGYTNRDYDVLIAAATILAEVPLVLACAAANRLPAEVPSNVRIIRDSPKTEFHRLMAAARLVVQPLRDDVGSSSQIVALAAVQTAKCVLYTDIPVVGHCLSDGLTGLACQIGDLDRVVELTVRWYADGPGPSASGAPLVTSPNLLGRCVRVCDREARLPLHLRGFGPEEAPAAVHPGSLDDGKPRDRCLRRRRHLVRRHCTIRGERAEQ